VAIEGVDTRALTRRIRARGAMRGAISTTDLDADSLLNRVRQIPQMLGSNLAQNVSPLEATSLAPLAGTRVQGEPVHVVVVDAGSKQGIVQELRRRGASVTLVPYNAGIDSVLSLGPDGVLVSNGPGDPEPLDETVSLMRALLERRIPLAGICLGHQLLGLALGATTYKMCFGHRGVNHPVKDLSSGRVLITTQNHGFAVDPTSLGVAWEPLDDAFRPTNPDIARDSAERQALSSVGGTATMAELLPREPLSGVSPLGFGPVTVTHLSLNDGTLEGLRLEGLPALSVQYHPEARPGPRDARPFFDEFTRLVEAGRA
jgi:carbamoyl-phosphate synthase small subunit